jgi:hypothetical protein
MSRNNLLIHLNSFSCRISAHPVNQPDCSWPIKILTANPRMPSMALVFRIAFLLIMLLEVGRSRIFL